MAATQQSGTGHHSPCLGDTAASQRRWPVAGFVTLLSVALVVLASIGGVGSAVLYAWPGCDDAAWQLCPGEYLQADQFIESESGDYDFGLGCLNEYTCWVMVRENGDAIWFDDAGDGALIIMQSDGNLVVYDDSYNPEWATNTDGNSGAWFQIQNDGNAVVYNYYHYPLWDCCA